MAFAERHPETFDARVSGIGLVATTAGGLRPHRTVSRFIPDRVGELVAPRLITALANAPELVDSARSRGSNIGFLVADQFAFGGEAPASQVEFLDEMLAGTPVQVLAEFFPGFSKLDKFAVLERFADVPTTDHLRHQGPPHPGRAQPQDGLADPRVPAGRGARGRTHGAVRGAGAGQRQPGTALHGGPRMSRTQRIPDLQVTLIGPEQARHVLGVIHGAFGDRPPLDPPATATGGDRGVARRGPRGARRPARHPRRRTGRDLVVPAARRHARAPPGRHPACRARHRHRAAGRRRGRGRSRTPPLQRAAPDRPRGAPLDGAVLDPARLHRGRPRGTPAVPAQDAAGPARRTRRVGGARARSRPRRDAAAR